MNTVMIHNLIICPQQHKMFKFISIMIVVTKATAKTYRLPYDHLRILWLSIICKHVDEINGRRNLQYAQYAKVS